MLFIPLKSRYIQAAASFEICILDPWKYLSVIAIAPDPASIAGHVGEATIATMPRSKRKRQSRIEFTPLPPSSPASAAYNQQIRDRAAAVRIDSASSASKRRKIVDFLDVGLPAASDTTRNGDGE